MGIGKVNTLGADSIAKINTLAKASISKISSTLASFAAAFTNTKAVSKSTTTGVANSIQIEETTDTNFIFTQNSAFSIGFWIKVGWNNTLNTNIHFFAMNDGSSTARNQQIRIFYNESNNRLEFRIGHDTSNRSVNFWALHSHLSVTGLAGSAASQYWSSATSANRGNVNADDFTHLMITKGTGTTLAASNIDAYWNGVPLGNAFYASGNNFGTVSMDGSSPRRITLGSNANNLEKCGNNNATVYNDLTIYNKRLSDLEVSDLYNSGSVTDATSLSSNSNLVGYYTFEASDGTDSSGQNSDSFTVNGDSAIVSV